MDKEVLEPMFENLFRTKPFTPNGNGNGEHHLHACLNALELTLLGMGAIIGAGIFVLTGVAAATKAGPGIMISYVMSGLAALFAALSYAELSASIGGCGSAYNYSYTGFGEIIAWIIGWDLILEYMIGISAVAIGWSGYVSDALRSSNITIPASILKSPYEGGIMNLIAAAIILFIAFVLSIGVKHSSRFNAVIVLIKLSVICAFIFIAAHHVQPHHWHPFLPFGWNGVMQGAALVFFAYIGFDSVSTAAEEAKNPQRDLPIGILASLAICTTLYLVVSALLVGIVSYKSLNVSSPVANALLQIGEPLAAGFIAVGAIAGLTSVMLVMYYGLSRVFLAISRDGLLPAFFARLHPRTKTPVSIIFLCGIVMALIAGFVPIKEAAELVNIGTLAAFALVCGGVIIIRFKHPDLHRPFKLPFFPLVPALGVFFCVYLMLQLPLHTWLRFGIWMAVGFVIYFMYGKRNSVLENKSD